MFVEELTGLSDEELEEELAAQAAQVDAARSRLVELTAECERRLGVGGGEGWTFAAWLGWRCALSGAEARQYERLAESLEHLPCLREAFAAGRLSWAKVSVLVRVAEPENEAELLELAGVLSVSQLTRAVAAFRQLAREQAAGQQRREFFAYQWGEDGSLSLRGLLGGEEGALLLRGLEAGREALWSGRLLDGSGELVQLGDGQSPRPSNAEALVALAELGLANPGGDRSGAERTELVVHVDAATLSAGAPGRCSLADGVPLAAETARRLGCDSSVVALVEREGRPLGLGRRRRTVSAPLRRALESRDRGCRFPGCERRRFVDAHHVEHWAAGGETNLDNLILLCRRHHRLVHEQGYTISSDPAGETVFRNQHGITLPNVPRSPPPTSAEAVGEQHRRRGLAIDGDTGQCGEGARMNLADAVDALIAIAGAPP